MLYIVLGQSPLISHLTLILDRLVLHFPLILLQLPSLFLISDPDLLSVCVGNSFKCLFQVERIARAAAEEAAKATVYALLTNRVWVQQNTELLLKKTPEE